MRYISAPLILLICLTGANLKAQWYNPEKVKKKPAAIYGKALLLADEEKYQEALSGMKDAIAADSLFVEAYLSRAGIYAALRDYNNSILDFAKAISLDSVFCREYNLPYSISLAGAGQFQKALSAIDTFLATPGLNDKSIKSGQYRRRTYSFAVNYDTLHKDECYEFKPVNLGDNINSADHEYFPSLTIDTTQMIFTRRINNDEDFFQSNNNRGKWSKATPVEGKLNTNLNEGAQNISQDGEWLVFTGCNYPEGEGSCDLYIAYYSKKENWSESENLGKNVNTKYWESSPSLSPDKRDLYFASNRPGGYGGNDIWVSHRSVTGQWSKPENLGPAINSTGDEGCPFIHADNQTLYFNSTGHSCYGAADIFLSRRDSTGEWGYAQNLGYPINTIDEEGSLVVASDGITSYYSSNRGDSKGGLDIYSFPLREEAKASKTLWVKGTVYDKKTNKGLPSTVELTEINSNFVLYRLQTDEDGRYLIPLPAGKNFAFNVNRKGYLLFSENFSLAKDTVDAPVSIFIPLQPLEPGATIVLKNIFFKVNDFTLDSGSIAELDKVLTLLNDNPKLVIEISGHTDNAGSSGDNLTLSNKRAGSVVEYLNAKGIASNRLKAQGYGSARPIESNNTEKGKALNRRTELRVISN